MEPDALPGSASYFSTAHLREDLGARSARGGVATGGAQMIKFVCSLGATMVVARLLTPQDYGLVGMVAVMTGFISLFNDIGLSIATVQRPVVNHAQISNLFWLNVALGVLTAMLGVLAAPLIAWFYREPRLTLITIALASTFILGGLTSQHQALLRRQMRFVALATIDVVSLVAGILATIGSAIAGAGYWALVIGQVATVLVQLVGVWMTCRWRPGRPQMSADIRSMVLFGTNLTGFNVVNYFARNVDNALIGRYWGAQPLGFYDKAYQLLLLPLNQINAPITAVAVPALSRLTDEPQAYRRAYCRIIEKIAFLTMPGVAFLIATSDWLIAIMLGPQWSDVTRIFVWLGCAAPLTGIANTTGWLFVTQERADDMFRWGMIGSSLTVLAIVIGVPWGPVGVARSYSVMMVTVVVPLLFWFVSRKGPVKQKDFYSVLTPVALPSVAVLAVVHAFRQWAPVDPLSAILLAAPLAAATFFGMLIAFPRGRAVLQDVVQLGYLFMGWGSTNRPEPSVSLTVRA